MMKLQRILAKQDRLFKGDMNPFDGGTPVNQPIKDFAGLATGETQARLLGINHPFPLTDMIYPDGTPKAPGSPGGGPSSGDPMADAYKHQADAALAASREQANAARYGADQALKGARLSADAAIQGSRNAAMGGILGAALGAHTTHEEIKQWLPSEVGAETIRSWDLAEKWNTTMNMKMAGYSPTAIEYALQGKSGKALWSDPQWNAMKMVELTKRDVLSGVQQFGIQGPGNPFGIAISEKDWMDLNSYKDPRDILEVDPAVAADRQSKFAEWEKMMRSKGQGLIVDIFKNPQLGGSSILTMKGKDALLDPALAPLIKMMNTGGAEGTAPKTDRSNNEAMKWKAEFDALNASYPDKNSPAYKKAYADLLYKKSNADMDANDERLAAQAAKDQAAQNSSNWDQAIRALTKGEENPMTAQVKQLMQMGIVDKYGMINAGELMKHVPPELQQAPEFKLTKDLTPEQMVALKDQYNNYATMKVDPKLIRQENMGFGVSKLIKLNADGSIAATAMQGTMYDAMGNEHFVSMSGNRLQEWYDRQSMIGGKGPLFPGMLAPVTQDQRTGRMETGFWNKNVNATPNNGMAGFNGQNSLPMGPNKTSPMPTLGGSQPSGNPYQAKPISSGGPASLTTNFGGAPLKQGED